MPFLAYASINFGRLQRMWLLCPISASSNLHCEDECFRTMLPDAAQRSDEPLGTTSGAGSVLYRDQIRLPDEDRLIIRHNCLCAKDAREFGHLHES